LLSGVTDDVVRRVNDYSAQHIAVTTWAFAKLETSPRTSLMQVKQLCAPFAVTLAKGSISSMQVLLIAFAGAFASCTEAVATLCSVPMHSTQLNVAVVTH